MSKQGISKTLLAVTGAAFMACSSAASAGFIQTISGNDCSGVFGQGFENCKIPANIDPNESPVIIKFDGYSGGSFSILEINSGLFPTIDGSEFSFFIPFPDGSVGDWTYIPGDGDPDINFFVAKGSNRFNLFSVDSSFNGSWNTPMNASGGFAGLSHLTFYDTGGVPPVGIPEPGTLLLLGGALAALSLRRRFRA